MKQSVALIAILIIINFSTIISQEIKQPRYKDWKLPESFLPLKKQEQTTSVPERLLIKKSWQHYRKTYNAQKFKHPYPKETTIREFTQTTSDYTKKTLIQFTHLTNIKVRTWIFCKSKDIYTTLLFDN